MSGVENFERLPDDKESRGKFAKLFRSFNTALSAAKVQGFVWDTLEYTFKDSSNKKYTVKSDIDHNTYLILALRYKELFEPTIIIVDDDPPYDIDTNLIEIDTGVIDNDYMNSRFKKYIGLISTGTASKEEVELTLNELHETFATLSQEEQKFAAIFLRDVQNGKVAVDAGKTLRDYINEYIQNAKNDQIQNIASVLGLDEDKLRKIMESRVTSDNINEFGRYDDLRKTVDKTKAKAYFEALEKTTIIPPRVNTKVDNLLRTFILNGGFDIEMP